MPFINTKTTATIGSSTKDTLTAEITNITHECLGKGENWIMVGFEDNSSLSFQKNTADIAYVEVKTFGTPSSTGAGQMTAKLTSLFARELSISPDRIYVAYFSTDKWGWNGNNL